VSRISVAALVLVILMSHPVLAQEQSSDSTRRVVTERAVPAYPDLARKLNLDGMVRLRVTVASDGTAKQTEVLGGNPLLAKAAQDSVKKWRWAVATHETQEEVLLNFHPKQSPTR
jgi:TonB family protein